MADEVLKNDDAAVPAPPLPPEEETKAKAQEQLDAKTVNLEEQPSDCREEDAVAVDTSPDPEDIPTDDNNSDVDVDEPPQVKEDIPPPEEDETSSQVEDESPAVVEESPPVEEEKEESPPAEEEEGESPSIEEKDTATTDTDTAAPPLLEEEVHPSPEKASTAAPVAVEGVVVDSKGSKQTFAANDDNDEEEGILHTKKDEFVLSFEDLTCFVPGIPNNCCVSADNPITNYLEYYMGMQVQERDPFYSLDSVSGYIKSGEMCLVLGSNDQSKSTLLRSLCDRLNTQDELYGTILLNGMQMGRANQGWRRLSPYVSASDASHSPVLTVRETFTFAAQCSCTGPPEKITARVNTVMEQLGLSHVADTVVGDENLRGISGGQKRRVTVGEMMLDAESAFFCLENITDGLASTDSFSLIEKLGQACRHERMAAFISLLQPSDEMVLLFDKLLVLTTTGEQAYFGPVDREVLRSVFLGPDADPSEDTGSICDLVLKQSLSKSFRKEDAIVKAFAESPVGDDLTRELKRIRTSAPPARERDIDALLPDKKYSTSRWYQFKILSARRLKLIQRNAVTYSRIFIAIFFAIIIGSLFSVLDNSVMGSLGRTGYMFLNSFLVLMLSAAVTIPSSFRERVTLFKQRSAEFYSGRMAYISQVLMDMPLSIVEAVLLSSISYFWVDMNPGANHFFFFMGTLIALECVGQALGRLLCALIRKQVSANALSSVMILMFGTVAGFMPSYSNITWVLRWLSWVTPVSYAFEALMLNEFADRTLDPISLGDSDGSSRLQPIPGTSWLNNFDLPRVKWASYEGIKIFDIFMLFLFAIIYDLIGMYYIELTREWYYNQIRRPQATVKKSFTMDRKKSNDEPDNQEETDIEDPATKAEWPQTLSVKDLYYSVKLKANRKSLMTRLRSRIVRLSGKHVEKDEKESTLTLLNGVEAQFRRGRMCALMGTSGAGKTTLMDVIAGYKTGGTITGDIMIDNRPKDEATWKKISGYAEQSDILNPYLSVVETLRFTASCRLPHNVDKEERVQQILELMDLEEYSNFLIGREQEGEGLEKHVRKRVTIAVQLVIRPRVLFLDEPTTGLGNNAAALVIRAVRRSTDAMGIITLATIHQPSQFIWDTFDDALLLSKGGRVAYMGEMGEKSATVLKYFSDLSNQEPPERCNPADYALEILSGIEPDEAKQAFMQSERHAILDEEIQAAVKAYNSPAPKIDLARPNNPIQEFTLLAYRQLVVQWRNPSYCFMRLTISAVVSVYMGLLFFGDKSVLSGAVSSIGAIFFLVFILVIPMQAAVVPLIEDRAVLYRETVSGMYSRLSYGLGQLAGDIPFHLLNTVIMFACFYFIVGFKTGAEAMGYFLLMLFLANWVITSLGQLFALATPNEESANGLAGLSVILSVILMGFLITVDAMPNGWVWAYWANLFHYILQGFCTNELAGREYQLNLDLGINTTGLLNGTEDIFGNATNLVAFDDPSSSMSRQSANLSAPFADLTSLGSCLVENECLTEPLASNFVSCTLFRLVGTPPCRDEFDSVTEDIDFGEVVKCFIPVYGEEDTGNNATDGLLVDDIETEGDDSDNSTLLCLAKAVLPPETQEAISSILEVVDTLSGIATFLLDILQNGIQIPGELILYFFGWAEITDDFEVVAPWKWWYSMGSVAIFLAAIEAFKIIAVQKIVWTKR